MLIREQRISREAFEQETGWALRPEGACKGDVCIPLPEQPGDTVDVAQLAEAMGLPMAAEPEHGLWALGPESISGHALTTAEAPPLQLPDLEGNRFDLASLRGQKILLYAWAPY